MDGTYYKTKESAEEYIRLAKDVDGSELIAEFKKFLPAKATILELGTGPGSDWNILSEAYEVVGSDNSKAFLSHLALSYPTGRFLELDAITIDTNEKFDGIYSNKVLHHLSDNELQESIKRQHDVLNPHGIICHSFWRGEGSEIFKGLFVNYHSKEDLHTFYDRYFDILLLEPYAEFEEADSLLIIGKKK